MVKIKILKIGFFLLLALVGVLKMAQAVGSATSTVATSSAKTATTTPALTATSTVATSTLNNKLPLPAGVANINIYNPIKVSFTKKDLSGWSFKWCNIKPKYWGLEISPADGQTDGWIFSNIPIISSETIATTTLKLPVNIKFSEIVIFYSAVPVSLENCAQTGCRNTYDKLCALNPSLQKSHKIFTVKNKPVVK